MIILIQVVTFILAASWLNSDVKARGKSGMLALLLLFILGPVFIVVWLFLRPDKLEEGNINELDYSLWYKMLAYSSLIIIILILMSASIGFMRSMIDNKNLNNLAQQQQEEIIRQRLEQAAIIHQMQDEQEENLRREIGRLFLEQQLRDEEQFRLFLEQQLRDEQLRDEEQLRLFLEQQLRDEQLRDEEQFRLFLDQHEEQFSLFDDQLLREQQQFLQDIQHQQNQQHHLMFDMMP